MPRNMYITSSSSSSSSFFVIVAVVVLVVGVRALRAAFVVVTLFPVFHSSPCTAKLYLHSLSLCRMSSTYTVFLIFSSIHTKAFASLFYLAGNFQSVINSPCRHMSPCVCFIERDHQPYVYTRTLLELIMKCNFPFSVQRITDSGYVWATLCDMRKQQQKK